MKELIDLSENIIHLKFEEGATATAFLVNYETRKYWVTAKHVFFGKERCSAEVFYNGKWHSFSISTKDYHDKFDIMTFTTGDDFPIVIGHGLKVIIPNYDNYGDEIFCLGFPYNASFDISISGKEIPFVKRGVISSVNGGDCYLIDKMVAAGFSGGPVLIKNEQEYCVIGVISCGSYQYVAVEKPDGIVKMAQNCPYRVPDEFT